MQTWKKIPRITIVSSMLIVLCAGLFAQRTDVAEAKPNALQATNVVISEFRTRGPSGADDEFIELYNPTNASINISGWLINASNDTGGTSTRVTIGAFTLQPGQYYLAARSGAGNYTGSTTPNATYTTSISDSGGIALYNGTTLIDAVGMSSGSAYKEGTVLQPLSLDADQSYERNLGGGKDSCVDDGNNAVDFKLITPSNPQNFSTLPRLCGGNVDLRISQTPSNTTPNVGDTISLTVTVNNDSVNDARNVIVKINIPAGITPVTPLPAGFDGLTGLWTIGTITSGNSVQLNLSATVNSGGMKTIWSEIWNSYDFDPDSTPGNSVTTEDDYAFSKLLIPSATTADLSVAKTVNNSTPNVSDNVVFTIIVSNSGPNVATNIEIKDKLPVGLTYVSDTAGSSAYDSSSGVWKISSIPASGSASLSITANVFDIGVKTNYAELYSMDQSDPDTADQISSATITPGGGVADLSLTQGTPTKNSVPGQLTFSITVANSGPYTANNVIVKDELASGFTYVSDTSGGTYDKDTGYWSAGDIPSAGSKTLSITVKVKSTGTFTNYAEIWSVLQVDSDSTPGNASTTEDDDETVTVYSADLNLTQTSSIGGANAVFTIRVTNSGPDTATNVSVSNSKLHTSSYTYVSSSASAGTTYTSSTGVWNIGSLASGATVTLVVTTTWNSLDENLAQVSAVTEVDIDSVPGNSSGVEDDEATTPTADLSLSQTIVSPSPYVNPEINSNITFRITVSNAGNANATNVKVKDLLPTGLTYVSHTSGQTYDKTTGIWSLGSLSRNTSSALDITAQVTSYGIRTNYAEISFVDQSDPDSNPGDSSTDEDDDESVTFVTKRAVIINEIAWAGTSASVEDEWMELYSPSDSSITIAGWTIRKNSCSGQVYITLESGKSISKEGYFLLERGSTSTDNTTVSDISANQIYLTTVPALLDTGEILYLCDASGNSVDTANVNGGGWPAGDAASPFGSMERQNTNAEQDAVWLTNRGGTKNGLTAAGGAIYGTPGRKNSTGNSSSAATATPKPSATPTFVPTVVVIPPRPILNEILPRPGYDWNDDGRVDVFDEFIEIKNLTAIDISLNGWKLDTVDGKVSFPLPAVTLKPGERVVYFSKETNLLLSDGGETVRLIDPNGKIFDAYTYTLARAEDTSICRLPDGNPGNSWFEDCIPTPKLSNTRVGNVPDDVENAESPVCALPDTIPADFFFAECHSFGADVWNPQYWDKLGWFGQKVVPPNAGKWKSFVE